MRIHIVWRGTSINQTFNKSAQKYKRTNNRGVKRKNRKERNRQKEKGQVS